MVQTASNGVDNYVTFRFNGVWPVVAISNCTLDVSEYNVGLNYRQDGTNDAIIIVNNAGTVV
jgi:hypothetical protein